MSVTIKVNQVYKSTKGKLVNVDELVLNENQDDVKFHAINPSDP